jgi:hypothetical protein
VGTCYKTKKQNPFRLLAKKAKSHLPLNKLQNFNLKISEGEGTRTKQNKITIINYSPPCKGGVAAKQTGWVFPTLQGRGGCEADGVGTCHKTKKQNPFRLLAEKAKSHLPLKQITNF